MEFDNFFDQGEPVQMPDVMVDLESMGTRPNAPIIAIGAVFFDMQKLVLGERFYSTVDLASSVQLGSVIDPDTVMWWLTQSDDARKALTMRKAPHVAVVLQEFANFMRVNGIERKSVRVWGCGPDFDCVLLSEHYRKQLLEVPWEFWNQRDYRTLKALYPNIEQDPRVGHHNALDDSIHQANHIFKIRRTLRGQS